MRRATRSFKVGLMMIISCALFVGMVIFIVGSSLSSNLSTYYILFDESVKGMMIGSKVNFQGIPVGTVTDIRFANGRTRVEIAIDEDKAVIQDVTSAHMDRLMITGQVTVELEGYDKDGKVVSPGSIIPATVSAFDALAQSLPEVITDVDHVLVGLRRLIDNLAETFDKDNRQRLAKTLANVEKASASLAGQMESLLAETRTTVAALRPALETMQASFGDLGKLARSEDLKATLSSVREAAARLARIEAEAQHLLADLRSMVGGSRRGWLAMLGVASDALNEVRMLARNLRLAPSSLIFGRDKREITVPATAPLGGGK